MKIPFSQCYVCFARFTRFSHIRFCKVSQFSVSQEFPNVFFFSKVQVRNLSQLESQARSRAPPQRSAGHCDGDALCQWPARRTSGSESPASLYRSMIHWQQWQVRASSSNRCDLHPVSLAARIDRRDRETVLLTPRRQHEPRPRSRRGRRCSCQKAGGAWPQATGHIT